MEQQISLERLMKSEHERLAGSFLTGSAGFPTEKE
jgi:hypothetical protein